MLKKQITDIIKSEIKKFSRSVTFDTMYDTAAERIMELFKDDREELHTEV